MALRLKLLPRGAGVPGEAREVGLGGESEVRIGRHPDNDLALPFAGISAMHARLFRQGTPPGWWLEDLGSSNGTWLGTRRLPPRAPELVQIGDRFRLGELVLVVEGIDGGPLAASAESTATIGRRLIGGGSTAATPRSTPAPSASPTSTPHAPSTLAKPRAPSPRSATPTTPARRRPAEPRPPAARQSLGRIAVIAFAVAMTLLAVSGLIALAISLR
jgi:pSer/pThr/pTyr-binding forkhead associated (FHA) protein